MYKIRLLDNGKNIAMIDLKECDDSNQSSQWFVLPIAFFYFFIAMFVLLLAFLIYKKLQILWKQSCLRSGKLRLQSQNRSGL